MKKIITAIFIIFISSQIVESQVPDAFKYQAVLRNSEGEIISGQEVSLKISIINESPTGDVAYSESHAATTSDLGMVSLTIGEGTVVSGNFQLIPWSESDKFLKIEIDESGGSSFSELGTFQLLSVPYALFAKDAGNKDDADADPTNELQVISISSDTISLENGGFVKLPIVNVDDADADPVNELQNLSLINDTLEISDGNKIVLPYDSSQWAINGNKIYYNTGNVGIGSSDPISKLEVKSNAVTGALFQVINANNDTVFAVYPDGVKVFVDPAAKGKIGGFAVSGRTSTKGAETEYLRVTADSTRIFVNEDATKGKIGGFAVSGRTSTKGLVNDYLFVTPDSTRIYVNDSISNKGKIGGFAVSGRTSTKGEVSSLMSLTKNNYFIGHQAGKNNSAGLYNSFIGYESGFYNTEGINGIFIGYKSGYKNETGNYNTFIGNYAGYKNSLGYSNVFIGDSTGKENTTGHANVFIGPETGKANTEGELNIFIGDRAGYHNQSGLRNIFIGPAAGYDNTTGNLNTFIGTVAGLSNTTGNRNIFMGQGSGLNNETGNYNVYIGDNSGIMATTNSSNVFLGYRAGRDSRFSNNNIYIGQASGCSSWHGEFNVFIGDSSGIYNQGNNNIFIGEKAGFNNFVGDENTYIGKYAGFESTGSGNVFIGAYAGYNEIGSNNLYIDNAISNNSEALIYGNFDTEILNFNGGVHIRDFMQLQPQDDPPAGPNEGTVYFDNGDKKLKIWNGTEWKTIAFEP